MSCERRPSREFNKGYTALEWKKPTKINIFEPETGATCGEDENGQIDKTTRQRSKSELPGKSAAYLSKIKEHKFTAPQKTQEELFQQSAKIHSGGRFRELLNEDESLIEVRGGDGTTPILLRQFVGFVEPLQRNIAEMGFEVPTLIQKCVIPIVARKHDFDLAARAETGSGKTAAFLFPIIHVLEKFKRKTGSVQSPHCEPYVIIISPTRELAQQLSDTAKAYTRGTNVRVVCSYGEIGVYQTVDELAKNGCDIFIATIGRLMHFVGEQKIKLANLKFLVLDEADKLVKDEIFFREISHLKDIAVQNEVASAVPHRTLMFSATLDNGVEEFAKKLLRPNYFFASIGKGDLIPRTVKQKLVLVSNKAKKFSMLCEILKQLKSPGNMTAVEYVDGERVVWKRLSQKILIFCNSRRTTNWLAIKLCLHGWKAIPTHGDRTQKQRQEALEDFEKGIFCDILVSTNVASRGLNLHGVRLIINFETPKNFEDYVHRIGRTGRAGNIGRAVTFMDPENAQDMWLMGTLARYCREKQTEMPETLKMTGGENSDQQNEDKMVYFNGNRKTVEEEEEGGEEEETIKMNGQ